ncbi:MAG TPA: Jag N-terminal domain-containing protein [Sulfurovum sp.]|jgi:spoIIIJ-associated protein|nr:MAG: hypothetical protein B7Y63_03560 [Sulfurovum sp. 35-42-20]OYZ24783.1 MAG: hypothetical protein B7Y23_08455 [Sulfurovum sp. 16-42-52]OYZ49509.1 MAG: hypothetical protein B7Y13_04400 [Sulfurovum sp. 24-42-9]OZA44478.1 MAG: hypothetical protein B7X80_07720 [Sulfurovum sp. 17-42-90]OZA59648.1 MAG: hypothetical protein B7X69_07265 [Sulfurovum sp. 39-42-12]HQR73708.1 Jag N-terminal domain-containing protein [Sulfurovum sp.]
MKKVEALTLEEAYQKASQLLECSISQLHYEVIQYPSKGIFGFLKKNAIIVASCKEGTEKVVPRKEEISKRASQKPEHATVKKEVLNSKEAKPKDIVDTKLETNVIVERFFDVSASEDEAFDEPHVATPSQEESVFYPELAEMIENQLKELLSHSCFAIDVVEVDVRDNMALIFIDGEDAALLIGKEGYRYNALSYMLFNWLHAKYELFIKLEIAEFLTSQQQMIRNYIQPVIETVEKEGKGKTRFLDGILVQIALEQLRERFPDKYVAVKTGREGKKFVVINAFNSNTKSHA